jgi:protein-disulfide isomerase
MLRPALTPARDHIAGDQFAPVQLVQYGDLQCPHCADTYATIKQLQDAMGDHLKYAFRHYPQPQIHPHALEAAIACEMAGLQGKFWYMHDMIFENQYRLSRTSFLHFAREIDLDTELFTDTQDYRRMSRKVISDFESGIRSGVNATPTFFINGLRYNGTNDIESLLTACRYRLLLLEEL